MYFSIKEKKNSYYMVSYDFFSQIPNRYNIPGASSLFNSTSVIMNRLPAV